MSELQGLFFWGFLLAFGSVMSQSVTQRSKPTIEGDTNEIVKP